MESLSCTLDLRSFQALVNGLVKRNFYEQTSFTNDYLREQLYNGSELEATEIETEIVMFEEVLILAVVTLTIY